MQKPALIFDRTELEEKIHVAVSEHSDPSALANEIVTIISSMKYEGVSSPNKLDVLAGRDPNHSKTSGNTAARKIVAEHVDEYKSLDHMAKGDKIRQVMQQILDQRADGVPNPRFLKRVWVPLTDEEIHDKVSHFFRDHGKRSGGAKNTKKATAKKQTQEVPIIREVSPKEAKKKAARTFTPPPTIRAIIGAPVPVAANTSMQPPPARGQSMVQSDGSQKPNAKKFNAPPSIQQIIGEDKSSAMSEAAMPSVHSLLSSASNQPSIGDLSLNSDVDYDIVMQNIERETARSRSPLPPRQREQKHSLDTMNVSTYSNASSIHTFGSSDVSAYQPTQRSRPKPPSMDSASTDASGPNSAFGRSFVPTNRGPNRLQSIDTTASSVYSGMSINSFPIEEEQADGQQRTRYPPGSQPSELTISSAKYSVASTDTFPRLGSMASVSTAGMSFGEPMQRIPGEQGDGDI